MWFYSDSFCVIQLIIWICTFGSRHLCCTCPAFWRLKRYQEPLLQQCIFGIHCGFDGDHHCNELVSSCTGEFCYSDFTPYFCHLWNINMVIFGAYAACSTVHCSWCDRFRCCSLFVEWRSKTGQILKLDATVAFYLLALPFVHSGFCTISTTTY